MKPSAMSKRKVKDSSAESAESISQVSAFLFITLISNYGAFQPFFFPLYQVQRLGQILGTIIRAVNCFFICIFADK